MKLIYLIILILLFLIFTILIIIYWISVYYLLISNGAPFYPSFFRKNRTKLNELFKFLESIDLKNRKMIDLGSGDGRIVIEFAKNGYESYGIEFNPFLVWLSRFVAKKMKIKNAYFIKEDLFKVNLRDFGIIYIYQDSSVNKKLIKKFESELKHGSIIISNKFQLPYSENLKMINKIGNFLVYQKK